MKKIVSIILFGFAVLAVKAQPTITPSLDNEYCPGVEYTFTVTIPKPYLSMIGMGGCYITQPPQLPAGTTFTFKGKFDDANQKQTFKINYTDGISYPFEFKKIKSLFFGSCTPIQPSQPTITSPRCQISTHNISFSNVQWKTEFEVPAMCFGSITNYEYLLPNGWSLGGITSNGSNWIPGGNNVNVTSNLSTGDGEYIYIRPINTTCGAGLYTGPQSPILISRPAPTLSISGAQVICSGVSTYTLNGLPAGATVNWSLSNTTYASIPIPSNSSSVGATRIGTVNTSVTLVATVSDCITTYPPVSKEITLGAPFAVESGYVVDGVLYPIKIWNSSSNYNDICKGHTATTQFSIPGATSVTWARTYAQPSNAFWSPSETNMQLFFYDLNQSARFQINASNACGSFIQTYGFRSIACSGGCLQYTVSPNPAKGTLKIIVPNIPAPCDPPLTENIATTQSTITAKRTISEIRVYDNQGMLKQVQKESKTKQATVNLNGYKTGIYIVEIVDGNYKERQQIIVE
jgi:hypothetical protein